MFRILTLLYGSVCYLIFLGTFLYAIGFVGNLGVPKSIDSGVPGALVPSLLVNAVLLAIFALQHTGMARKGFKRWWTKMIPNSIERSTYVLFSSLSLLLLYWQWRPLPAIVWNIESPAGRAVVWTLFAAGWLLVLLATFLIHHFDLFGVRQVWLRFQDKPYRELGFRTPGLYKYLRHPIQVGFLIAFWATPTMTVGHLVFSVATAAYIFMAVKLWEERDLLREHGERYRTYMDQVGGFLPKGRYQETGSTAKAASHRG
jgi:protein-S-isoprenylcysteine O-methyltransferase Ste14